MKVKSKLVARQYTIIDGKIASQKEIVKGEIVFTFSDKVKNLLSAIKMFFRTPAK